MEFPLITSKRLELKEINASDNHAIYEIFSNTDVVKYYDLAPFERLEQADKLIEFFQNRFKDNAGIRWGIFHKGKNTCIGTCGFNSWNENMHSATIGYDLNKDYWGQGIITEALFSAVKMAFSEDAPFGALNRIQADTIPGNVASERVLIKLGFKEEGLRRQSGFWKNQYHDLKCFGLLKKEWELHPG